MDPYRRTLLAGLSAALLAPRPARAASVTDGAGRAVSVPARVERVFPAGPPAAITLYTLAPELLIGWPRANRADEREFLLRRSAHGRRSDASPGAATPPISRSCWRSSPISSWTSVA